MKKTPTSFGLVSSITAGFTSGLLGGTGLLGGILSQKVFVLLKASICSDSEPKSLYAP
jgi:hypothetical protein